MNRRNFFRTMVGGVAAAAAVRTFPFRVFSFPSEIKIAPELARSIRFVRCFDPIQSRMINRFDVLYGFGQLYAPNSVECAEVANAPGGLSEAFLRKFEQNCIDKYVAPYQDHVDGLVEHYHRKEGDKIQSTWISKSFDLVRG